MNLYLSCLLAVSIIANIVIGERVYETHKDLKNNVIKWNRTYYLCIKLTKEK